MVDSNTIWRSISLQKLVLEQESKILTVVSDYLETKKCINMQLKNYLLIRYFPDQYKTQQICD